MTKHHYSLTRAIQCARAGRPGGFKKASGYEAEMHQELARTLKAEPTGFLVPLDILHATKAQNVSTAPAGGFTVGHAVPTIGEALRPSSIALSSGALMVDLKPGAIVPRIATGTAAYWLAETEECPESSVGLSALSLEPRRCAAWLKVSNQLLQQAPIIDSVLTKDLRQAVGAALDLGIFSGVGGVEPRGLLNSPDVVLTHTFGGATTRGELTEMEEALGDENANDLNAIWVTTPGVRKKWRDKAAEAGGGTFLWNDENKVLGRPARASNNITENRVILGDFSDLIVVNWGALEISDPYTQKRTGETELLVQVFADAGPMRGKSFIVSTDSAAQ